MTDIEKVSELLKPRYKVIADYPNSHYKVGEILEFTPIGQPLSIYGWKKLFDEYPHLFRKLEWWEERTIEEFTSVKFAKVTSYIGYWLIGDIVPVEKFVYDDDKVRYGYNLKYRHFHPLAAVEPATAAEYEAYQSKDKQQ